MDSVDDLIVLVRDELGLPLEAGDADVSFDELPGWDSVHLLWLLTALERSTGSSVSLPELLETRSLSDVYALVDVA